MSDDQVKRFNSYNIMMLGESGNEVPTPSGDWVKYKDYKATTDRIDELEAKLAKAVGALGDISNGEPEWPDDPQRELDWCRNRATTTLEALKGQDDE